MVKGVVCTNNLLAHAINYVFLHILQLRNVTYHINAHRFINMADIKVKPRSVLPTYRDSRQVSLAQVLANCSHERMLKLLGSARCQNDFVARVTCN